MSLSLFTIRKKNYFNVAPGIWGMKIVFVNIYMIADDDSWVLVDTGLSGSAKSIQQMAYQLFGNKPPAAILLTHGHFDHRGSVLNLLKIWNVPVYAHRLELPYLTGISCYPPTEPMAGGGLMSLLSFMYPVKPIDIRTNVRALPVDGSVPFLSRWKSVFTPGHSSGHCSFFRESDKVLLAGDAFVTTKQEAALATILSLKRISGPPKYFTPDWISAKDSVTKLRDLRPVIAATGHGKLMKGSELTKGLNKLVINFDYTAVPAYLSYDKETKAVKVALTFISIAVISALAIVGFISLRNRHQQS